jgi:hypothetical protein
VVDEPSASKGEESIPRGQTGGPPIHPLSALLLVTVDNLWMFPEFAGMWVFTAPLSFLTVFFPTYMVQRHVQRNKRARAFKYALLLGGLAAIPTSITGTPVGLGLLAWTGISKLFPRSFPSAQK